MKTGWKMIALANALADAKPGFACGEDPPNGVFQFRMNNITSEGQLDLSKKRRVPGDTKKLESFLVEPGDVLFNATNSPELVGKSAYFPGVDEPAVFSNHFLRLRPKAHQLSGRFLARWLVMQFQRGVFQGMCRQWVNQATVGRDALLGLQLPLPPLNEQRRIADVLDRAEELLTKRRAALDLLDKLTQAIFLDMFGDPVSNERKWPRMSVSDFVAGFESGKSLVADDEEESSSPYRVLKVSAVTSLEYRPNESKAMPPGYVPQPSHIVRDGDLLFSRANTSELIGATAYVFTTPPNLLLPDKLWRFVWHDKPRAEPHFVRLLFQHPKFRFELGKRATGTSGSMKNISQEKVLSIVVGLPPLPLQKTFAARIAAIDSLKQKHKQAELLTQNLFQSLQHRAFRGEL